MALIDLKLNAATHDIDLTDGSPSLIEGRDADAQDIDTALQLFQGEWYLNPFDGLPYHDRILIRNVNEGDVLSIYSDYLQRRRSVSNVDELDVQIDAGTDRSLTVVGRVTDSSGSPLPVDTQITI